MLISLTDSQTAEIVRSLSENNSELRDEVETLNDYLAAESRRRKDTDLALDSAHDYLEEQTERLDNYMEWADEEALTLLGNLAKQEELVEKLREELALVEEENSGLIEALAEACEELDILQYAASDWFAEEADGMMEENEDVPYDMQRTLHPLQPLEL